MSAITTTPAPSVGRKPLAIGLAVLGVITVGAVAVPRIHLSGTSTTPSVTVVQAPDTLDRRDAMRAAAADQWSLTSRHLLDAQAKRAGRAVAPDAAMTAVPQRIVTRGD